MITVIIPTYKPQYYLYECLLSLKQQETDPKCFEIILMLNGDKESYFDAINKWITEIGLTNCKLFYNTEKGVSHARNAALSIAKGKYIAFIDDDDKLSANYLSGLRSIAAENVISVCNTLSFADGSNTLRKDYISHIFDKCKKEQKVGLSSYKGFFTVVWGKLIPMGIIGNRRFNPRFANGEDALFMAAISDKAKNLILTNKDVIYYRRARNDSASQSKSSFAHRVKNSFLLSVNYIKVYFKSPLKYNLLYFIMRIAAVTVNIFKKPF